MKRLPLLSSVLALSLALSTPAALAHVGHGDEFQAEGGVNRVEVNAETDSLLGIQVDPIESAADGSGAVLIPVTALVEDNGRQLVFVQYENFYEPVPVTTGESQGEMVAILEGLSVGEQLVTQGSLSLYAESRKTQTAEAEPAAAETTSEVPAEAPVAEATEMESTEMESTEMEASEVAEASAETTEASGGFPMGVIAALGAGAVLLVGAVVVLGGGKKGGV
ncbi:cobalt transporter [Leptolyngbya sp. KIOST-1]|uniref:cobalt transporter n=1 Tax=Leptolyngbya sp. KIOST-1 TaxID=1229172 RepID=UPI00056B1E9C|nr:cobalt transporter [Leptolyngbya sp. KIOST-1]